jgi:predicted permease
MRWLNQSQREIVQFNLFILAPALLRAYMRKMERKAVFIVVSLVAMLAAAVWFSFHVWTSVGADANAGGGGAMNGNGVAALVIGGIGSLVLGGGLMALVFFSSRRGYDDAADLKNTTDKTH